MNIKKHLSLFLYVGMLSIMAYAFSLKVGSGWYYHNDGVTIACSMESALMLMHPGEMSVLGCTYDHQPFYQLLVKLVGSFLGYNIQIFQWINVFFYVVACWYIVRTLKRKNNLFLSIGITFFYFSSFSVLYWIQEIRMYALYLMTCTILMAKIESEEEKESWTSITNHIIGYFNFFMYVIPFGIYSIYKFFTQKLKDKRFILFFIFGSICLFVKLPYVIWWRLKMRSGNNGVSMTGIFEMINNNFFEGNSFYVTLASILAFLSVCYVFIPSQRKIKNFVFVGSFIVTMIFMLITIIILEMHEIELRYFLFLTPILIILTAHLLNNLLPEKSKLLVGLALFSIGFFNAKNMYTRGYPDGGEIKRSAIEFTKYLGQEIRTDNEYFFYNYIGIYSELMSQKNSRPKVLKENEALPEKWIYATAMLSKAQHNENLKQFPGDKKLLWQIKNFLGHETIFTEVTRN